MLQNRNVLDQGTIKNGRPYPESTSPKRQHATPEPRFLPFRRNPLIHTLPQPYISLHIPRVQQNLEVARELDYHRDDIRCSVPGRLA